MSRDPVWVRNIMYRARASKDETHLAKQAANTVSAVTEPCTYIEPTSPGSIIGLRRALAVNLKTFR